MQQQLISRLSPVIIASILSGCTLLDGLTQKYNPFNTIAATQPPTQWQAPLPHGGQIKHLNEFWQQYPNPVLLDLITQAQMQAPDVATAVANMAEARANRVKAGANLLPKLDGTLSASRSLQQPKNTQLKGGGSAVGGGGFGFANTSPTNTYQANLQASWELDLYGSNSALRNATIAQEHAANASWHEARVSVAAEVATSYFNYVLCRQQSTLQDQVFSSSEFTAKLTEIAYQAGFKDAGEQSTAIANMMDAKQQAKYQVSQCELEVKNLTALTYYPEPELRQKLATAEANTPQLDLDRLFVIEEIPATAIRQRPDIYRAEVDVIRAAADIKQAVANRLPSVSLQGSIGWLKTTNMTFESKGRVWSLGPIQLTLPIFDGGALKATQDTAEARYLEASAKYRGAIQNAVKETETALVNLHDTGERQQDVLQSLDKLATSLHLTEAKEKAGFASKLEVEEAKRNVLQAQKNALTLQQTRANAWLNLYRAAGGGWQSPAQQAQPLDNASDQSHAEKKEAS
jgi:NodT family efflux transporter outer membrane factor (OMF) lipoprotein